MAARAGQSAAGIGGAGGYLDSFDEPNSGEQYTHCGNREITCCFGVVAAATYAARSTASGLPLSSCAYGPSSSIANIWIRKFKSVPESLSVEFSGPGKRARFLSAL
jgi:hypothetical protein